MNIFWGEIRESVLAYASKMAYPENKLACSDNLSWLRYEKQIEFLHKILVKKSKILEIGCSFGHTVAALSVSRPDLEVIAVELKRFPLWNDFQKYGCKFIIGSGLNLPFKDATFDAILSFGVIEHVTDDKKFLSETNRVLCLGGPNIIFGLPQKYSLIELFARLLGLYYHPKKYTKGEIYNLLIETDFRVDSIRKEGLVPGQVYRLSKRLNAVFNKAYFYLDKIDSILSKTPLYVFSQNFRIVSYKRNKCPKSL